MSDLKAGVARVEGYHGMTNFTDEDIRALVEERRVHRSVYLDADLFELEMERIFGRSWVFVGHDSQVAKPGDFLCTRIGLQPVILVRHSDGTVRVLYNRCGHRGAEVVTEESGHATHFRCGYHGLVFDHTGQCTHAPGQDTVPPNAHVTSYPVADRMGLTWVWMGLAEKADTGDIFDLPQFHDPTWGIGYGDALFIDANYLLLCDNLCDPTHVVYVHPTTLGVPGEKSEKVTYERTDWGVKTTRWTLDGEPIAFHKKFGNFFGNVDRWQFYLMYIPSVAIIDFGGAATGNGAYEGRRDDCIQVYSCHFMTPETETTTYDYWLHVRNFATSDAAVTEGISDQFRTAFAEDKAVLESIQIEEERHGTKDRVGLNLDGSAGLFRRMVVDRIRNEALVSGA